LCLTGFVGVNGPSNLPCNNPKLSVNIGSYCTSNSNCLSGYCLKNKCSESSKVCPANCNNKGGCVFYDYNNQIASKCLSSDYSCRSVCKCNSGKYGADCSLNYNDFATKTLLRDNFCYYLRKTVAIQDSNSAVVTARLNSVLNIFSDINQINNAALHNCSILLINTVIDNADLICQTNDRIDSVIQALSTILSYGVKLPSYLSNNISFAIQSLTVACQLNAAAGESPISIITNNIKLNSTPLLILNF
jgi:hypothetical protein